jgi:hypothetical protein
VSASGETMVILKDACAHFWVKDEQNGNVEFVVKTQALQRLK